MRTPRFFALLSPCACGGAPAATTTADATAVAPADGSRRTIRLHRAHQVGDRFVASYRGRSRTAPPPRWTSRCTAWRPPRFTP